MLGTFETEKIYHHIQLSSEMFDIWEKDYDNCYGKNILDVVEFWMKLSLPYFPPVKSNIMLLILVYINWQHLSF